MVLKMFLQDWNRKTITSSWSLDPEWCHFGPSLALWLGGRVPRWFQSYLKSRFQRVVLGKAAHPIGPLAYRVPWGSMLSFMLFNICIKLLGKVTQRLGLSWHQFASDTHSLFLAIHFPQPPWEQVPREQFYDGWGLRKWKSQLKEELLGEQRFDPG